MSTQTDYLLFVCSTHTLFATFVPELKKNVLPEFINVTFQFHDYINIKKLYIAFFDIYFQNKETT